MTTQSIFVGFVLFMGFLENKKNTEHYYSCSLSIVQFRCAAVTVQRGTSKSEIIKFYNCVVTTKDGVGASSNNASMNKIRSGKTI